MAFPLLLSLSVGLPSLAAAADEGSSKSSDLSLEDILNLSSGIATKKQLTARESPGIVSIITSEEIKNSGARDLFDILNLLVPGLNFGVDVESATGLGIRGIWAIEGKVLLLIDGIEANEEVFGNTFFKNHYPASIIDRVEVIRGPGSAVYGGYASLGVISVTTKGPSTNGVFVQAINSQMSGGPAARDATVGYGKKVDEDLGYSMFVTSGTGNRSDRNYTDYFGSQIPMVGNFQNRPFIAEAKINYKGLDFRGIIDRQDNRHAAFLGKLSPPHDEHFHSTLLDLKYDFKVDATLLITARAGYKYQAPFAVEGYDLPANPPTPGDGDFQTMFANHKNAQRFLEGLSASWDVTPELNLLTGVEAFETIIATPSEYRTDPRIPETFNIFSGDSFSNWNLALYAQAFWKTPWVNVTLGGRFEDSLRFGSKFVPRIGLTKVLGDFHAKLQIAQSFRTPSGVLADRVPPGVQKIFPETVTNYEIEVGYRLTPEMILQANLFDSRLKDVIIYAPGVNYGTYLNQGVTGSRGIEAEYRYQAGKKSLAMNYAFYTPTENTVVPYNIPGQPGYYNGFPKHRMNLIGGYHFTDQLSVHPSLSYFGVKYAFTSADATGADVLHSYDPYWLLNFNLRYRDLGVKGLDLAVGTHNLLNANNVITQGYNGRLGPYPIESRTYDISVGYTHEI